MITVSKLIDVSELERLTTEYGLDNGDIMITQEDGRTLSLCWVRAEGKEMQMRMLFSCDKDGADIAIRGALAYGDNRFAQICFADKGEYDNAFKCVGFTEKDGRLFIEINKVVHYGAEK